MPSDRREFLRLAAQAAGAASVAATWPAPILRALQVPAAVRAGTIRDVAHVVILMQENRSFDHYFGTLRGVRGFGDRHPIPLTGGRPVWRQSDGERELPPYHLDTATTSALRVPVTPHAFADAQAAWDQGRFGAWPKFKTAYSMGYYERADIPFQFALAEAFTICDAYHCSVTTGTDPNRIVFWSGSNYNPEVRARGENCTEDDSEPNNLRCWIKGALPSPGYTYAGSAFRWSTIPDVLEEHGISWRIYQNPNDNWTGAMHGCLAFESFRTSVPGSPIYERGMRHWSLDHLAADVKAGSLPQVSWILPSQSWSEHPSPSTPAHGAEFTTLVLDALTANPDVWAKTVFFLTFDENDGQFDHVPPPAVPSYNPDGSLAGGATLDLAGEYFLDPGRKYRHPGDVVDGPLRPWGLGPRVPMYVISPWSKGGWVNSQVFDHTSVGQFLEKRFDITVPAISPWHRAVCGDLVSTFDFVAPNDPVVPALPDARGASAIVLEHIQRPMPVPPARSVPARQEPGVRPSRALPYTLHVDADLDAGAGHVALTFRNTGRAGAVFHVYDRHHLDRIPRRYTVEAGKSLSDTWSARDGCDLEVHGPNGFLRVVRASSPMESGRVPPVVVLQDDIARPGLDIVVRNPGAAAVDVTVRDNAYGAADMTLAVAIGAEVRRAWPTADSGHWYDVIVSSPGLEWRFAGRVETGAPSISDPAG